MFAKISLDTKDYEKGIDKSIDASKNVEKALKNLSSPIDKVKSGFTAVAHPIETAVSAFENFKSKASAIIHPIESFKSKMSEAKESIETQRNTLQVLTSNYNDAEDKVSALTKAFNESVKKTGTTSEETKKLATELEDAKAEASEAKGKMEDYATGVNKAGKESKEAEGKIGDLAEKLGNGLKVAGQIGVTAITAATTAVVALTKQSVEAYAEYEQLLGGVETLFGQTTQTYEQFSEEMRKKGVTDLHEINSAWIATFDDARTVVRNAEDAYKTAGMSANEYMSTVTSFSASLIQSLGGDTAKAAEYAQMAVVDMSDNANKMGSDISTIQTAYAGFAKQNYSMLDNLKLGYGGTALEMHRLLSDAAMMNEEFAATAKFSIDSKGHLEASYADIVKAINIVQTNMGITGTTAKEAATTIQGSAGMMKAAWENLITGMSDSEADLGELFDNLIESAEIFFENLMPTVEQALYSITEMIGQLAPVIVEKLPALAEQILPALLNAATSILSALGTALPGIFDALSATIIQISGTLSTTLKDGLLSPESLQKMFDSAFGLLISLGEAVIENLPLVVSLGLELLIALANGIAESLPELIPTIVDVVLQIVDTLTDPTTLTNLIDAAIAIVVALANALLQDDVIGALIAKAPEIIQNLVTAIVNNAPKLLTAASEIVIKLATGIIDKLSDITDAATEIVITVVDGVKALGKDLLGVGKNIVEGVKNGIEEAWKDMKTWLKTLFGDIITIAKNILGIKSPSRVFAEIGMFLDEGLAKGIKDYSDVAVNATEEMIKEVEDAAQLDTSKLVVTPTVETAKATGAIEGVDFNALATSSIDGIASIAKSVDYNALVNASIQGMSALVDLFKSGEAKVGVGNTRDLRRALNA